jgi:hypothetical protein
MSAWSSPPHHTVTVSAQAWGVIAPPSASSVKNRSATCLLRGRQPDAEDDADPTCLLVVVEGAHHRPRRRPGKVIEEQAPIGSPS